MRPWHYLRKNDSTRTPLRIIIVDTESYRHTTNKANGDEAHTLRLWCASYYTREREGYVLREERDGVSQGAFWDWTTSKGTTRGTVWIVSHNAAFDSTMLGLWDWLTDSYLEIEKCILEDPPTVVTFRKLNHRFRWIDSLNYWRLPLDKIAESYSLEKYPLPSQSDCQATWLARCRQDTKVLETAFMGLLTAHRDSDMGCFQPTGPGLAFTAYRHKFMDHPILIHGNDKVCQLERSSYYGGEVRCGYIGKVRNPIHHLDINGLYPSRMRSEGYPARLVRSGDEIAPNEMEKSVRTFGAVARVRLLTTTQDYPADYRRKTVHCRGSFVTTLAGAELERSLRSGDVVRVYEYALYDCLPLFTRYVDYWWQKRKEAEANGNHATKELCKLMHNALYGKFGQKGHHYERDDSIRDHRSYGTFAFVSPEHPRGCIVRRVAGVSFVRKRESESYHSFPAIAAFVTADGRESMRGLRRMVQDGEWYYQDTDSLHTSGKGATELYLRGLLNQTRLGALKTVGVYSNGEYMGWKRYRLGSSMVHSGISRHAVSLADGVYLQSTWQGLSSILEHKPDGKLAVESRIVEPKDLDVRGEIQDNGWVTPVWRFE